MKKISVVTINLNRGIDLETTIKSFITQKIASDVEYIVVDGMSEDDSQSVIERYREYIDLALIEKDEGIFDAMNKGVDLANGDYTYFLNSGDVFANETVLSSIIDALKISKNRFNIICGKVDLYNEDKYLMTADLYPWIPHQGAFVKTEKLRSYRFDKSFKIYGDLDLWTRMKKEGDYSIFYIDKPIANFKLGGIGNNPNNLGQQYEDRIKYLKKHNYYAIMAWTHIEFFLNIFFYSILGKNIYLKYRKIISRPKKIIKRMLNFKFMNVFTYRIALHLNGTFPFLYPFIKILKLNPFRALYDYYSDLNAYNKCNSDLFPASFRESYPQLYDRYDNSGNLPKHYFYQDLWAARKVYSFQVDQHFDIGSRVDGFISHCLVFTQVTMIDIRPLNHNVEKLNFIQTNATNMLEIKDNSINSLSTLHAVEHFGLGRYGDPIDDKGYLKAMNELKRVLSYGGNLLFSVPVGRQRLMFNAHRIFDPRYIIEVFLSGTNSLQLVEFSVIDDRDLYIENANPEKYVSSDYSCGLFHFRKPFN